MAWPTWAFQPAWPKQGSSPVLHRCAARRPNLAEWQRAAGEGGAREQASEVRVLIWGIGSGGAHRGGLAAVGNWQWQAGKEVESAGSGFMERR
jgi:hypothetical protein